MLLTDARRAARTGPNGELIPLDEQDRSLWNRALIAEGIALVSSALSSGVDRAVSAPGGDRRGARRGRRASRTPTGRRSSRCTVCSSEMSDNPMVALNRAIAAAMVHGPDGGARAAERARRATRASRGHYRLDAVRGHLLEMAGDRERAIAHYRAAAERTASIPERDYLTGKAARLAARPTDSSKG